MMIGAKLLGKKMFMSHLYDYTTTWDFATLFWNLELSQHGHKTFGTFRAYENIAIRVL